MVNTPPKLEGHVPEHVVFVQKVIYILNLVFFYSQSFSTPKMDFLLEIWSFFIKAKKKDRSALRMNVGVLVREVHLVLVGVVILMNATKRKIVLETAIGVVKQVI